MPELSVQLFDILHQESVGEARRAGKALAETMGMDAEAREEIALVINELGTNLVKHSHGGRLILTPLATDKRVGLQIETVDDGPGIADVERVITDGVSTTGSLGVGLGTVNRLMDELNITSERGRGTRVVCRKWARQSAVSTRACPLEFGIATRSRSVNELNGDAAIIKRWGERVLAGVIDGVGHGEFAHGAAQTACQYVEGHFDLPLAEIFRGVSRACRSTRGVVMALALFDWGKGQLTFASLGNIEVRIHPSSKPFRFVIRRGIIGLRSPNMVVTEHPWLAENIMVLHSDGLATHWSWEDFPGLGAKPAATIANELLVKLARDDDDATVLVARSKVS